ncbi:MAG: DUF4199 domain-containing protein [Cyclobacteriaceae bacterium]
MENSNNVSTKSVAVKYGLISGLVGIIFFVLLDFIGQAANNKISWIGLIFTAIIMVMAHKEFKSSGDGFMSYKQGLGLGTIMSVVGSVISSVFTFFYVKFISPEFIDVIKEQQIMEMEKSGMSDAEIDQAMSVAAMFMGPTAMMVIGLIMGVLLGFIIALIVSAFTKKERQELV